MKVLFLTKYTRKGASSRLRTFQYLPYLVQNNIEVNVSPFFDDKYLEEVYRRGRHNKWFALKSFLRRLRVLLSVKMYDKVVIEKEVFPYFPALFEWALDIIGVRYIVDYDDAIFHNYDLSPNPLIRWLLGKKISTVVKHAEFVTAGNEYLKHKFLDFGARKVVIVPTVIDTNKYRIREINASLVKTIGWIGSPITFKYIHLLRPVFERLMIRYSFNLVYVGANKTLGLPNETIIEWREDRESEDIRLFDIGIMPLEDNIWERGKCGYKLIQYMGSAVPVVGTPIGVNNELIKNNFNGFKAITLEEWEDALSQLLSNSPEKNRQLGLNGRTLVENGYSLCVYEKVWLNLLKGQQ